MRIPGEILETNNMNRPRIGIIVTQRNPLVAINPPIQNNIQQNQQDNNRSIFSPSNSNFKKFDNLLIEAKSNFSFNPVKKNVRDSNCQSEYIKFQHISNVINFSLLKNVNTQDLKGNIILNNSESLTKTIKKTEKIVLEVVDKKVHQQNDLILKKGSFKITEIKVNKNLFN